MSEQAEPIVPDGGVTDEPMPVEWQRAYAEAYPDRLAKYVEAALQETTP